MYSVHPPSDIQAYATLAAFWYHAYAHWVIASTDLYTIWLVNLWQIRVITKLPNSEQSYKGKVKTHNYLNRQNQSTTEKLWKP
jgi:hypothetical protein